MKHATEIIIRPLLTEKTTFIQRMNQFTFEVAMTATKIDIRRAIEELGKCRVASVNTLIVKGKFRRRGNRAGRTPDRKKAVVTLAEGETLGGVLAQASEGV